MDCIAFVRLIEHRCHAKFSDRLNGLVNFRNIKITIRLSRDPPKSIAPVYVEHDLAWKNPHLYPKAQAPPTRHNSPSKSSRQTTSQVQHPNPFSSISSKRAKLTNLTHTKHPQTRFKKLAQKSTNCAAWLSSDKKSIIYKNPNHGVPPRNATRPSKT